MRVYDADDTILLLRKSGDHLGDILNPDIDRNDVEYILTGRHEPLDNGDLKTTLSNLGFKNIKRIIFNPLPKYGIEYLAKWKADVLNELGATEYVDNDDVFANYLRKVWDGEIKTVYDISTADKSLYENKAKPIFRKIRGITRCLSDD